MSNAFAFPNDATPPGSAAYYAVRFAAPPVRDELAALFAWYGELQKLRTIRDREVARVKLRWWRDETGRAATGQATHPLARAMGPVLGRETPGTEPFHTIADAFDDHLRRGGYRDHSQVAEYHRATGGTFAALVAALAGEGEPRAPAIREAGAFQAAVNILARLGAEISAPAPLLPRAILTRHLADPASPSDSGGLVRELCAQAAALRPAGTGALRGTVAALTALADARLAEVRRAGDLVMHAEIDLPPLRKLWITWRRR